MEGKTFGIMIPRQMGDDNYDSGEICFIVFIVLFLIILLVIIGGGCAYKYKNPSESFTNAVSGFLSGGQNYNALYTSPNSNHPGSFSYTQPPGDVKAQEYGRSGQGTNGGFLPLQGMSAGTFMLNSSTDNLALPSPNPGKIGGQANYTTQEFDSSWVGFNDFGFPFNKQKGPKVNDNNYSNSYTIDGANQRVSNPGQKSDLPCENWWPTLKKGSHGYCTQGSDAMVPCKSRNINDCLGSGGLRFVESKLKPQWKKL